MIDEELLGELAYEPTSASIRPLSDVVARAALLRRRKRSARVLVSAAAVAAATAVVPALIGGAEVTVRPAGSEPSAEKDCTGGFAASVSQRAAAGVLYRPTATLVGPMTSPPITNQESSDCAAATVQGSWYTLRDGAVTEQFEVSGPAATDPYSGSSAAELGGSVVSTVRIGSAAAILRYSRDSQIGELFWIREDGTSWRALGMGMTRGEVLAAVRSLAIEGSRLDADSVPDGLTTASKPLGGPVPGQKRFVSHWEFGGGASNSPSVQLEVTETGDVPLTPTTGARPVSIGGRPGWLSTPNGRTVLYWQVSAGVEGQLNGSVSVASALKIAGSVYKVEPNSEQARPS